MMINSQYLQHVVIHYLGATYCVLAPEHEFSRSITTPEQKAMMNINVFVLLSQNLKERN